MQACLVAGSLCIGSYLFFEWVFVANAAVAGEGDKEPPALPTGASTQGNREQVDAVQGAGSEQAPAAEPGSAEAAPRASANSDDRRSNWERRFKVVKVTPNKMVRYAPLGITVDHLVRNPALNPLDEPISDDAIGVLQSILAKHQERIRTVVDEQGTKRHHEMLERHAKGVLPPVESLSSRLSPEDAKQVEQRTAALVKQGFDETEARRHALKEQLMRRYGYDAALTGPDGRIYMADPGSLRDLLADSESYRTFLSNEFFGELVLFFAAQGLLDDARCRDLLTDFFSTKR